MWVFGYGSLMWRPGFVHVEEAPARLNGLHRSLCVLSHVHRGTPEAPGLVLGLDRGGSCRGLAFRVPREEEENTLAYLRAREQPTMVYKEVRRKVLLLDGSRRAVRALCYVVDRAHGQYAGVLPMETQIELVRRSRGQSGPNAEYVLSTIAHLRQMEIHDPSLERLSMGLGAGS
ncbi:gamma-glutamylcyclotransferase [Lutibaculum baratangense]|nr:gamma-glutamylcyclotransferase [Lutibaculum baratangense]